MTKLADTIESQAQVLQDVLGLDLRGAIDKLVSANRVWLVGTGTSQHAAELGALMLRLGGTDARASSAASFVGMRPPAKSSDALLLITHTGETAFARTARQQALAAGSPLVSITATGVGWEEAIEAAPREASETYTASYTAALMVLARVAGELGAPGFGRSELEMTIAAAAEAASHRTQPVVRPQRLLAIAGVGPAAITAREGALKIREAARVPSEGFEAEYLLHGSAVPLGVEDQLLLLEPAEDPDGLLPAIGEAAAAEGVDVAVLSQGGPLDPLLRQVPLTVRLQVLASALAECGGEDPDSAIQGAWGEGRLWKIGAP